MTDESTSAPLNHYQQGGSAFPLVSNGHLHEHECVEFGMSLRDWFAGQALAGLASDYVTSAPGYAYKIADLMLEERCKKRVEVPDGDGTQ